MTETSGPVAVVQRRPALVWLIFLYYALTAGWSLVLWCLLYLGLNVLPPDEQALFASMSTTARLFAVGISILHVAAATYLWLLRQVALPLFSLVLVLDLATSVKDLLPGGRYNKMLAQGPIMVAVTVFGVGVGTLITVGIWWYVLRLRRRGLLN